MNRLAATAILLALGACATVESEPVAVTGAWGGRHIGLQLTPAGGTLEYDCASGTIGPVLAGPGGAFQATGTHTPAAGGPEVVGEVRPSFAASYSGRVNGNRMTFRGRVDNGVELGPFELRRGAEPGLFRCL